ncbi:MAG: RES domain-containing protein [Pseudomonadota bacterium]
MIWFTSASTGLLSDAPSGENAQAARTARTAVSAVIRRIAIAKPSMSLLLGPRHQLLDPADRMSVGYLAERVAQIDSPGFPILYGAQDVEGCVHECRVTLEDELFFASLSPSRTLRLLDLTHLLEEEAAY